MIRRFFRVLPVVLFPLISVVDIRGRDSVSSPPIDGPSTPEERFYENQHDKLFEEYRRCTGDTAKVTLETIVQWRESLYRIAMTPDYQEALRSYRARTGEEDPFSPCVVLKWERRIRQKIEEKEQHLSLAMLEEADRFADTLRGRNQLAAETASPFDFAGIPLGITATSLKVAWGDKYSDTLSAVTDSHLRATNITIDSVPFDIIFQLDSAGRYIGYRIDGRRYPPDSLDGPVRSETHLLSRWITNRAGPPQSKYRIGLFDIKTDHLAPQARWNDKGRKVVVGIAATRRRYFARAEVKKDNS
ncbi:MAG: hypothetical protein GF344_20280, partial [Chitinivibrionales bacterium]|nr:hypothetical protein [Chitinivibrionales bacterium]MBD3358945.1 hypothetical protein [Chitinivibrionales bacterium]